MICHLLFTLLSHTGVSLHLGRFSGPFLSLSKKQSILADSTTVSEFVGTHSAVQKVLWAHNLLTELGYLSAIPTTLFKDNKSTIRLISHKGNSGRTNHIALRFNMIRKAVKNNNITNWISFIRSEDSRYSYQASGFYFISSSPASFAQHFSSLILPSFPYFNPLK